MAKVVSVQFKGRGKAYYFDPCGFTPAEGEKLVVETSKGLELGVCSAPVHEVEDSTVTLPLRPVVRIATVDDLRVEEINRKREKEAFGIAEEKIAAHGLEMKLVDVECSFEGNKILFFFTADGRVDFRELVKDLAGVFRTRIELRRIGVRDEARMLGGIGICGQPYCCSRFLNDFQPVSTKMAKTQSMSLNPTKISGCCGRLMCCLRYEQEAYEDLVKHCPKAGTFVETPEGYGTVTSVNLLRQNVKVKIDGGDDLRGYDVDEIAEIPGGRPPEGEPLPHMLKNRVPKKKEELPKEPRWEMPSLFAAAEEAAESTPEAAPEKPAKQPKAPVPESAGEEGKEPAAGGSGGRNRRRRHRGGEKPAKAPEEKKPAARAEKDGKGEENRHAGKAPKEERKPRSHGLPAKPAAPKEERKPRPAPAEGGEKPAKSGSSRHRHHHRPGGKKPEGGGENS